MIQDFECRPQDSDQGMLSVIRTYNLPIPEIYVKSGRNFTFCQIGKRAEPEAFFYDSV